MPSDFKVVVKLTFSYLGSHSRVEGVLILCRAHLLPPDHLLQTHIVIILEVPHTLPVNMGLNLVRERRRVLGRNRQGDEQGKKHWKSGAACKIYSHHILEKGDEKVRDKGLRREEERGKRRKVYKGYEKRI